MKTLGKDIRIKHLQNQECGRHALLLRLHSDNVTSGGQEGMGHKEQGQSCPALQSPPFWERSPAGHALGGGGGSAGQKMGLPCGCRYLTSCIVGHGKEWIMSIWGPQHCCTAHLLPHCLLPWGILGWLALVLLEMGKRRLCELVLLVTIMVGCLLWSLSILAPREV